MPTTPQHAQRPSSRVAIRSDLPVFIAGVSGALKSAGFRFEAPQDLEA